MNRVVPGPMTGMKPGLPFTTEASSETKPSPGPKMTEGRKIVAVRPEPWTAFSPAAFVRAYSDGESWRAAHRAHVQVARHGGVPGRKEHVRRGLAVHAIERLRALFVDDADQMDDCVAAGDSRRQRPGLEHVATHGLDRVVVAILGSGGVARQDGDRMPAAQERVDQMRADEAGPARDEDLQYTASLFRKWIGAGF